MLNVLVSCIQASIYEFTHVDGKMYRIIDLEDEPCTEVYEGKSIVFDPGDGETGPMEPVEVFDTYELLSVAYGHHVDEQNVLKSCAAIVDEVLRHRRSWPSEGPTSPTGARWSCCPTDSQVA